MVRQPTDYVVRRVCTINLNTKEGMNPTEATVCKLWGKTTLYDSSATQVEVLQFMASTTDKVPGSESMLALCERCCKSDDGTFCAPYRCLGYEFQFYMTSAYLVRSTGRFQEEAFDL